MEKKMTHAIERKAFEVAIDAAIKHTNKDRSKALLQLVDLMEKTLGDGWSPQAYEALREIFRDENSKWMQYANHLLDNTDPKLIKMAMLNLGYEAGFRGFNIARKNAENTVAPYHGYYYSIRPVHATFTVRAAGQQNMETG